MKNNIKITILGLLLLSVSLSTESSAQVKSDYDRETDFTEIKTYSFEGWARDSDQILNEFDKKRITEALANEFKSRGLKYVESGADVAITLYIVINQKTSTTGHTSYTGSLGYYGGRRGWARGYGGTSMSSTTTYHQSDYLKGTFVVDMYSSESKKLLWQGVITSVVQEKPEKREKTIPKKIKKLMKRYPVKPMK